jgi:hypothetical protein
MFEQERDALSIVGPSTCFCQGGADVDSLDPTAQFLFLGMWNRVGNHELLEMALIEFLTGRTTQYAVSYYCDGLFGTVLDHHLGCLDQSTAGIGHIVDDDGDSILHISYKDHARHFIWPSSFLMDQSKTKVKTIGD